MLFTACNVVKNIESNYCIFSITDFWGVIFVRNDRIKLFNSNVVFPLVFFSFNI